MFRCVVAFSLLLVSSALAQERLHIVTTTTDLRSLVEAVGGDRVEVTSLVPAGTDAEEYQPKPQDVTLLKDARMVVRVGLDFDIWFDRLLARAMFTQSVPALQRGQSGHVDASYAIAVLDVRGASVGPSDGHAHGSGNPHFWLDPKNAEIITGNIVERLAYLDSANSVRYEANRNAFLDRLAAKIKDWEARLAPLQGRPMIAYHNDWAYFARRFRLNIVDFIEPKPGVPPSAARLASLINTMRARNINIIVRQPNQPEQDVAFLAQKTGAQVVLLAGSVGTLPGADSYISLFDTNVAALVAAHEQQ